MNSSQKEVILKFYVNLRIKKRTCMKEIDINAWTKVGEGGNGATYTCDAEPGVLLKESYLELAKKMIKA